MSTNAGPDSGVVENDLEITERAAEEVNELLDRDDQTPADAGLRLYVQQGGCAGLSYGMRFEDQADEDDICFESNGITVYVDPASWKYVSGSTLDFDGGLQGEGFLVDNPNVVSECGCGESFRT